MSEGRRAEDHPKEPLVRLILGILSFGAAVYFGVVDAEIPMAAFMGLCGAMVKVPIGKVLPK